MASAWGNSWGFAWGDSWGSESILITVATEQGKPSIQTNKNKQLRMLAKDDEDIEVILMRIIECLN